MGAELQALIDSKVLELPEGLRRHIYRVQEMAQHLAKHHGADEEKVRLGALAHDLARAMKGEDLLKVARELRIPIHEVEEEVPILLHGPVAAELLRQQDGLDDEEIHEAIYWHSIAHKGMGAPAKVVFLADKLDPLKRARYPFLPELKVLALQNLDVAVLDFLNRELAALLRQGSLVHPISVEARNDLLMVLDSEKST